MTSELQATVLKIFLGGLVGLFPILFTSILSWTDKRSLASKQQKALELAKSRIDFIEKWVKVQQTLNSPEQFEEIKQETSDELAQIRKGLSELLADDTNTIEDNEKNLFERAFLIYRPLNLFAWLMHMIYYFVLAFTAYFIIVDYKPGVDLDTGIFTWDRLFFIDLIPIIIFLIPLIIIRAIAVWVDRKANTKLKAIKSE